MPLNTRTKKREVVEVKNNAESAIYLAEKSLKDAGDKVPADVKEAINKKVEDLKSVKDGSDAEAIKKALANLSSEIQKIGQAMYGDNKEKDGSTDSSKDGSTSSQ